ncbi:MAG: hypothetical protein AAF632_08060 [Bacteroidota bacterium]
MEVLSDTLLKMLANPRDISAEDQEILENAITKYPYFQLARTLVAKAKHDQQAPDAYKSLGHAAIYAPDRRHLRKVFYEDIHIDWQSTEQAVETPVAPEEAVAQDESVSTDENPVVANETEVTSTIPVEDNAEGSESEITGVANHDEEEEIVYQELEENLRKLRQAKEEVRAEEEAHSKKKILNANQAPVEANSTDTATQSPLLLDYLHGIEPISSDRLGIHQQKQNELINKFVNSDTSSVGRLSPTLPDNAPEALDLSEKSASYDGNLVTENLAGIMLKQGKKNRAIKIYQQLMLKFPDKKAYFAEKIEKLN